MIYAIEYAALALVLVGTLAAVPEAPRIVYAVVRRWLTTAYWRVSGRKPEPSVIGHARLTGTGELLARTTNSGDPMVLLQMRVAAVEGTVSDLQGQLDDLRSLGGEVQAIKADLEADAEQSLRVNAMALPAIVIGTILSTVAGLLPENVNAWLGVAWVGFVLLVGVPTTIFAAKRVRARAE